MIKLPTPISSRDYEGIIIDLLDDIMSAEQNAKILVDRLDSISKRSTFRVVDVDFYLWPVAAITVVSFIFGIWFGFIARGII